MAHPSDDPARLVSTLMQVVLQLNGRLLARGDALFEPLGLNSARWQVLGAISQAGRPLQAPQLAEAVGVTRQGAQKQLHQLAREGLIAAAPNPRHQRSPLYGLTAAGRRQLAAATALHEAWTAGLAAGLPAAELADALGLLEALHARLADALPRGLPSTTARH